MFGGRVKPRIAVIGAGIAGLSVSASLAAHAQLCIFEKSRGVGGRMSARRHDPWQFDHGTQFFTARHPAFREFLAPLISAGVVSEWQGRVVYLEAGDKPRKRQWFEPHYVACPAMSGLCKHLGTSLDIRAGTEVAPLGERGVDGWRLRDAAGTALGDFDAVICTAPSPQAVRLLDAYLPPDAPLRALRYRSCFALMAGFETPWQPTWIAGKARDNPVEWIAAQSTRPGRSMPAALVAHASAEWSDANLERPLEEVQQELLGAVADLTGLEIATATHVALHRWRYALVDTDTAAGEPWVDPDAGLAATGDWCSASRVEDAWLAGKRLAERLLA